MGVSYVETRRSPKPHGDGFESLHSRQSLPDAIFAECTVLAGFGLEYQPEKRGKRAATL